MNKKIFFVSILFISLVLTGCNEKKLMQGAQGMEQMKTVKDSEDAVNTVLVDVVPAEDLAELEDGLSSVRYEGDYGFDAFLSGGGASSDGEVIGFLKENLLGNPDLGFMGETFGCSTIAAQSADGKILFGRNFDWNSCNALIVISYPENDYASVSTVNMDFIYQGTGGVAAPVLEADEVKTVAALYAPLDGMNEKGLAVSVNMIQDSATINQDTERPDITTTTAIRLLLNKAGTVEEALELLTQYDMHASMGMTVHLAVVDATGKSVVVEYIDNEMTVTETPVVTNFYLAEGEKYGIGTEQSHERYEILMNCLEENEFMDETEVREALDLVSKDNFGEFESTEWSIVFDLKEGKATYYHRENYTKGYVFSISSDAEASGPRGGR